MGLALAQAAGDGGREAEDAEAAALADEADMPIEQLLARYGIMRDAGAADVAAGPPAARAPGPGASRRAARGQRQRQAVVDDGTAAAGPTGSGTLVDSRDSCDGFSAEARPAKRRRADVGGLAEAAAPGAAGAGHGALDVA